MKHNKRRESHGELSSSRDKSQKQSHKKVGDERIKSNASKVVKEIRQSLGLNSGQR
jgi:hypothetical protein